MSANNILVWEVKFEDSDFVSFVKGSKDSVSVSDSVGGRIMAERDSMVLVVASLAINHIFCMALCMLSRTASLSGHSLKNLKAAACEWLDGVRSMLYV